MGSDPAPTEMGGKTLVSTEQNPGFLRDQNPFI